MKKVSLMTLLMVICSTIFAQNEKKARISFRDKTYNFGTFDEEVGKVTTEFEFTNTGDAPLLITRTAASCGCTTPEYPKEPIAPGKKGKIIVTYNAAGRPGSFAKTVYIFANTDPEKTSVVIKGQVNAKKSSKEDYYPRQIGDNLRIKDKTVPFYDVYNGTPKVQTLGVLNEGKKDITVDFYDVPKHLSVRMIPSRLSPNDEGFIEITYDPDKIKDWGLRKDHFKINVSGSERNDIKNKITVTADIRENFDDMTEKQRAEAPVFNMSTTSLNFGIVKEKTSRVVKVSNTGKSKLIIRKVKNDSEMISFDLPKKTLAPGEEIEMKVWVDPGKASTRGLNNRLYLITNDPENPSMSFKVLGVID